jgi:hypothetical protein
LAFFNSFYDALRWDLYSFIRKDRQAFNTFKSLSYEERDNVTTYYYEGYPIVVVHKDSIYVGDCSDCANLELEKAMKLFFRDSNYDYNFYTERVAGKAHIPMKGERVAYPPVSLFDIVNQSLFEVPLKTNTQHRSVIRVANTILIKNKTIAVARICGNYDESFCFGCLEKFKCLTNDYSHKLVIKLSSENREVNPNMYDKVVTIIKECSYFPAYHGFLVVKDSEGSTSREV